MKLVYTIRLEAKMVTEIKKLVTRVNKKFKYSNMNEAQLVRDCIANGMKVISEGIK